MTDLVIGKPVAEALDVHEAFLELMQGKGAVEPDEDVLEDGIAFAGVAKFPARIKCALLALDGLEGRDLVGARRRRHDHHRGASMTDSAQPQAPDHSDLPDVDTAAAGAAAGTSTVSEDEVTEAMKDVVDPELGINVVDLGLVYGVHVDEGTNAVIDMTLTSRGLPADRRDRGPDQSRARGHRQRRAASTGSGCRRGARTRSPTTAASSCGRSASTSEPGAPMTTRPDDPPEAPDPAAVEAFWRVARVRARLEHTVPTYFGQSALAAVPPPAWSFGATRAEADELLGLVLAGTKTATSSARADYDASDDHPAEDLPSVGGLGIVTDADGRPRALVVTTEVSQARFDEVDEEHAWLEGEGNRSLLHWRDVHETFFSTHGSFSPDMQVVLERFAVLHQEAGE